jgi:hypothetical protein
VDIVASAEQRIKALTRQVAELQARAIFWEAAYLTLAETVKDST